MEIHLKQDEIEKAVHQYIAKEVNLRNKKLSIDFTAGRGSNGLSATLVIDNVDIPGFTEPATDVADQSFQAPAEELCSGTTLPEQVADLPTAVAEDTVEEVAAVNPAIVAAAEEVIAVTATELAPEKEITDQDIVAQVFAEAEAKVAAAPEVQVAVAAPATTSGLFGKPATVAAVNEVIAQQAEAAPVVEAAKPTTNSLFGTPAQ